ncbi:cell division protein SepF [Ureibacillus sinduriensis]|uniref:Cell division protein SepF n=1 Tax=Ureibacillus sinduriensis BLB-1 = JCM 15800 TaxID=1384057 RepID=A0A0A3HU72_9BACL|nr:cell division protein SepF [Ureibacillus sinduriensis]KGR73818.1 cell division protein SepF [Ureibacillus sinduriensis BLB-1 = JCM 15800]
MSMKNKIKNFFYLEEDEEAVEVHAPSPANLPKEQPLSKSRIKKERKVVEVEAPSQSPRNVVSLQAANSLKNSKVVIAEPRVYAEAQDISEHLKNKRAIIVNLQRIDREAGIRIIDFLSGTVYALGGDIQRIGTDIFLCTPENVEVSGEISNYFSEES